MIKNLISPSTSLGKESENTASKTTNTVQNTGMFGAIMNAIKQSAPLASASGNGEASVNGQGLSNQGEIESTDQDTSNKLSSAKSENAANTPDYETADVIGKTIIDLPVNQKIQSIGESSDLNAPGDGTHPVSSQTIPELSDMNIQEEKETTGTIADAITRLVGGEPAENVSTSEPGTGNDAITNNRHLSLEETVKQDLSGNSENKMEPGSEIRSQILNSTNLEEASVAGSVMPPESEVVPEPKTIANHQERETVIKRTTEKTDQPHPGVYSEPNTASGMRNAAQIQVENDASGISIEKELLSDQKSTVTVFNKDTSKQGAENEGTTRFDEESLSETGSPNIVEKGSTGSQAEPGAFNSGLSKAETNQDIEPEPVNFEKTVLSLRRQELVAVNQVSPVSKPGSEGMEVSQVQQTSLRAETSMNNNASLNHKVEPVSLIAGGMDMDAETMQTIQSFKAGEVAVKETKLTNKERSAAPLQGDRLAVINGERSELKVLEGNGRVFESTVTSIGEPGFSYPTATLTAEQEALLQEYMVEEQLVIEPKVNQDSSMFGYIRLGELPIANATARRNVLTSFSEVLRQAKPEAQENTEVWQKHSFELEDGNNIELTTRSVDGVLQIKIAASNSELNRLLQQHLQEIKDHLENELTQELDLQFDQNQEDNLSRFFGQSPKQRDNEENTRSIRPSPDGQQISENHEPTLQHVIRKFGYNQMEWIG
ncbi:MAG: hypothetical protein MI700_05525 [Balneolales bacterium]|nr:hypothetical protein [Balneolales bacterium]